MIQRAVQHQGQPAHDAELSRLAEAISHAAHMLPAQGPITVFIHHNTLHAFEDLYFEDAVVEGARVFGCQPYLSEERYRQKLNRGRILPADLLAVLRDDLGNRADEPLLIWGTRLALRMAMLQFPLRQGPSAELRWFVAQTDALRKFRSDAPASVRARMIEDTQHWVQRDLMAGADPHPGGKDSRESRGLKRSLEDLISRFGSSSMESWSDDTWEAFTLEALWRICREGVHGVKAPVSRTEPGVRHRDALVEAGCTDIDPLVNAVLIRFSAAYLDQGFSTWPLPHRERGYFQAFTAIYNQPGGPPDVWLKGLTEELSRIEERGLSPLESIHESLEQLGIPHREWDDFLTATFLALRGWGGMIREVEQRSDRVALPIREGSLLEFLAVRLILERLALAHVASGELDFDGSLRKLRDVARGHITKRETGSVEKRAFFVFQLTQLLGWLPRELARLSHAGWSSLITEAEDFSNLERRRVFHLAFERRYRVQTLDAMLVRSANLAETPKTPSFQVICCLDEREESFRRHIEEFGARSETWGAAGFFGVPIYYRGVADAHYVPLCPVMIRPEHWVREDVAGGLEELHQRRAKSRRLIGAAQHQIHVGSRNFASGALLAAGMGLVAWIPLVARVLFPRTTSRMRKLAARFIEPPQHTELELERSQPTASPEAGHIGFTVDEMAQSGERLLRDLGLTSRFARLVVLMGHGSNSLNNPHNSAYNCGACGGNAGGPNARAMARILNDPRVREQLETRGISISDKTVFIGAWHNTCNDQVTYFDLDKVPESHADDLRATQQTIEQACDRNAHERCRRFISAPLTMSFTAARRHVEARSEDLAQTRPECGHATNAVCYVGRRSRTRGLYMDRRTFLTSYDPTQDDDQGSTLTRLLGAAVPVCGGINLEYYFSYVDPAGFGCGTKLPHNVTSLLGVMDGAASDLRPGLPWQMVEIHEPVRLLFIIESTPEIMLGIMQRNPGIGILCRHRWVQVTVLNPESAEVHVYTDGRFEPYQPESQTLPTAKSSTDWYRGWRDHLGYALIDTVEERCTGVL